MRSARRVQIAPSFQERACLQSLAPWETPVLQGSRFKELPGIQGKGKWAASQHSHQSQMGG